jgi:predicted phosphate transport protein (TIGR00153 family)
VSRTQRKQEAPVRIRLIPRDEAFFPLFDEAATNLAECAGLLRDVIGGLGDTRAGHARINECERRGDELTQSILRRLDQSFVAPFDREDIHALTEQLDDVVDDIHAVSELMVLHDVDEPLPEVRELVDILAKAADASTGLIAKLSRLRGIEADLQAVDRLESEGDHIYRRCVARLFSGDFNAFDVLRWKGIVEAIESAINGIEKVSDVVAAIVIKHA